MSGILVDTGPLVAILDRRDSWHGRCVQAVQRMRPPMLTCWPVISEAFWLLRHEPKAIYQLLHWQKEGIIRIVDLEPRSLPWIALFHKSYEDQNPDLADAALMYLAETTGIHNLFTLDQRDFSIYRLSRNRKMKIVPI